MDNSTEASHATGSVAARLTVGIATFRRPVELLRLLSKLAVIDHPNAHLQWYRTVVIDNSPAGDARTIVEKVIAEQADGPLPAIPGLTYIHEPEPGLSAARNAAVAWAEADWLAFIDDDEEPEAGWLVALAATAGRWPTAQAVVGPVIYRFPEQQPIWLEQTRLFEPMALVEGEPPIYFATGNAMVRTDLVAQLGPLFDPYFGQLGGEDHHLGLRLEAMGAHVVSSPQAMVVEHVPAERVDKRWALKRMLRKGSSLALTETRQVAGRRRVVLRMRHLAVGLARIGQGIALVVSAPLVKGRTPWPGYRGIVMGLGQISGALDRPVEEYRRTTESPASR